MPIKEDIKGIDISLSNELRIAAPPSFITNSISDGMLDANLSSEMSFVESNNNNNCNSGGDESSSSSGGVGNCEEGIAASRISARSRSFVNGHHRRRCVRSESVSTTRSTHSEISIPGGSQVPNCPVSNILHDCSASDEPGSSPNCSSKTGLSPTTTTTTPAHSSLVASVCRLVRSTASRSAQSTIRMRRQLRTALLTLGMATCLFSMSYVTRHLRASPVRHPLTMQRYQPAQSAESVRYLTFGSSSTWGIGLELSQSSKNNNRKLRGVGPLASVVRNALAYRRAYPYLLSPQVHNAANRIGGLELSSMCTESVVGDDSRYDVIVLEVSDDTLLNNRNSSGLRLLAQRLHRRFPNAAMVFADLRSPAQYEAEMDGEMIEFDIFRQQQGHSNLHDPELATQANLRKWSDRTSSQQEEQLTKIAEEVRGQVFRLPRPTDVGIGNYLEWFIDIHTTGDESHRRYALSARGHQVVARGIQDLVKPLHILDKKISHRDLVQSWGSGDMCQLWYETADTSAIGSMEGLTFRQFSVANNKYALEVPQLSGGSMTVANPFDEDRMVYLTYMTTSADSHPHKIYPRTRVELNGKSSVVLDPYHNDGAEHRHLTRTTAIGVIPAHSEATIRLESMEQTLVPFRVVGASLFATEKKRHNIPMEFAFEPEPATVGRLYRHFW